MTKELNYTRNFERNTKYFMEICKERIDEISEMPYTTEALEKEKVMHERTIEILGEKLKDFRKIIYVKKQTTYLMENEPRGMFMMRIGA